jgi:hypothetical protein
MSQVPQQEPALQEKRNSEVVSNPRLSMFISSANAFKQRINQIILGGVVKGLRATLYVKGVRTTQVEDRSSEGYVVQAMGELGAGGAGTVRVFPDRKVIKITTYKSVLPEDQKAVVEMVKAAALRYGFELKVVDVTEESFLQKLGGKSKGISTFPAFVTDSGLRIEGDISEERIKALLK